MKVVEVHSELNPKWNKKISLLSTLGQAMSLMGLLCHVISRREDIVFIEGDMVSDQRDELLLRQPKEKRLLGRMEE